MYIIVDIICSLGVYDVPDKFCCGWWQFSPCWGIISGYVFILPPWCGAKVLDPEVGLMIEILSIWIGGQGHFSS
jgi:hypothetical protein